MTARTGAGIVAVTMHRRIAIVGTSFLAIAILAEIAFRAFEGLMGVDANQLAGFRSVLVDGVLPTFEARPHTVYARPRHGGYSPARSEDYNSLGFNDAEWPSPPAGEALRILCLGGSTTESGNKEGRAGQYPFQLERILESETGREFVVMNAGMSAWTSAEILVAWFLSLQDFEPDVVVFHEGINDLQPRFRKDFRADYTHWRTPLHVPQSNALTRFLARWSDLYLYLRLRSEGVPDIDTLTTAPKLAAEPLAREGRLPATSARPFLRNVACIASSARDLGAAVVLMSMPTQCGMEHAEAWYYGVRENNTNLERLAGAEGYFFVDAAKFFAQHDAELRQEFLDIVHLTGKGNLVKARLVANTLLHDWCPELLAPRAQEPR